MNMDKLQTSYGYHDAKITEVVWESEDQLRLEFQLDAHWNQGFTGPASLLFSGVRNRPDVESGLSMLTDRPLSDQDWDVTILAFSRESDTHSRIEVTDVSVLIVSDSFHEMP